jgi:phenylacetate-coenzyme A ligase PaaK-like adenylate-forming protein
MIGKHAALAYWLARDARATVRALDLEPESLRALTAGRLRALLVSAHRTPFLAERMRVAGLRRPGALRDAELPLALQSPAPVSKHEMREAGDAALRDGRASPSWFSSRSSGSSGEPFRVYYDARAWSMLKYLVKARSRRAAGMRWTDSVAILDAISEASEGRAALERAARVRRISVFRAPAEMAAMLAAYQPAAVYGLPSALLEIAHAIENGAPPVRTRRIFTSGELLTGHARRSIAAAFGASLYDVYGTSETKEIAWECAAGSRHVSADVVQIEILDHRDAPVPVGTEGEIVVTLLVNRAMPLLRYRTGDRGALLSAACSCGRATPLLGVVSGRTADTLEFQDGTTRSPYQLTMALEQIPGLAQYQITQEERGLLRVKVVADARADLAVLRASIADALRLELPSEVRIDVMLVDRLERGPRAKVRVVHPLPLSRKPVSALAGAPGSSQ